MAINRDKILKEAERLVQKGKVEQAIKEYEQLLKANPNDANTINRIGDLYGRVGQIDKAITLYEKIATNFTEDGFATKAIAILKKINRLAPQRLDIFHQLAELYIQQGLMVEAKNQFQILADWYVKNNDTGNAIKAHQRLIQLDPSNHMAHLRLADLLIQGGRAKEAIAVYDRLGRLLLEREKLDEAERLYRHALDAKPPSGDFIAPLCNALLDAGRTAAARDFLADAIAISPESHELHVIDVRVCLAFGNAELARKKADMILTQRPDDLGVRLMVGQAMIAAGQPAGARELLIPAAEAKIANRDFVGAQEVLQGLVKAMPQDRQVLEMAVRAYEPTGDSEMAFTLKAALADSLFRTGNHDEAKVHYHKLLQVDPENKFLKQRMAQLEGAAPSELAASAPPPPLAAPDPAPTHAPPPVAPAPPPSGLAPAARTASFDPAERLAEATVFAKYGLVDKAQNHLEDIVATFPNHAEARERLATLLAERGNAARSAEVAAPLASLDQAAWQRVQKLAGGAAPAPTQAGAAAPAIPAARPVALPLAADEAEDEIIVEIDDELSDEIDLAAFEAPAEEGFTFGSEEAPAQQAAALWEEVEWPSAAGDEAAVTPTYPAKAAAASNQLPPDLVPPGFEEAGFAEMAGAGVESSQEISFEQVSAASFAPRRDLPMNDEGLTIELGKDDFDLLEAADGGAEPVVTEAVFADEPAIVESVFGEEPEAAGTVFAEEREPVTPADSAVAALVEAAPPASGPPVPAVRPAVAPPARGKGALSQLDELERLVGLGPSEAPAGRRPPPPVQPPPPLVQPTASPVQPTASSAVAPPPPAAAEVEADVMVEISDSFSGPPLSELQQIDFFIQQELHEDALRLLGRLEVTYPNDAEIAQRRLTLKSKGVLLEEVVVAPESPEDLFSEEDEFFDLARELEEELAEEEAMVEEATGAHRDEAELEEVFREFQKGVAEQLSEEDSDTHFNLGIAYKEMGLVSEAIREFQISSRDPKFYVECCSMIAVCYVEQGMFEQAADWYGKALATPGLAHEASVALRYDKAAALEAAGDEAHALAIYHQLNAESPGFRDVGDRLALLGQG